MTIGLRLTPLSKDDHYTPIEHIFNQRLAVHQNNIAQTCKISVNEVLQISKQYLRDHFPLQNPAMGPFIKYILSKIRTEGRKRPSAGLSNAHSWKNPSRIRDYTLPVIEKAENIIDLDRFRR